MSHEKSTKLPSEKSSELYLGHRQRLKQKFLETEGKLPDYELLELLLFYIFPRRDTKELAKKLLKNIGSLQKIIFSTEPEILSTSGLGQSSVVFLRLLREIFTRVSREKFESRPLIRSDKDVMNHYRLVLANNPKEHLYVMFLDSKSHLIKEELIQTGVVSSVAVHPEIIIKKALTYGARALIMVHNHPSGDATPSREDIVVTRELKRLCESLNISLLDHFLVGNNDVISFHGKRII